MSRRASLIVFILVVSCAAWVSTWRPTAQPRSAEPSNAVQRLGPAAPARLATGDRGATYHWLDQRAVRVTTRFVDAVAVTERIPGGDLKTRLTDAAGRELAEFGVDRVSAGGDVLTFRRGLEGSLRASGRASAEPTLDWSNRQAYTMWKDGADQPGAALEWQDNLIRARGRGAIDFQRSTLEVRTDWLDGFSASSTRSAGVRPHPRTGVRTRGTALDSRLTRDNLEVGRSRWYPEEQVYVWSVPGLTAGYMDAERMKDVGGWTFTPDLAWSNVQTYAFHHFHSLVASQGFVARNTPRGPGWLGRLAGLAVPTLHANEPGCDGLHWLDTTIFRPCCDMHDLCYEKYGCSSRSWWEFWSSWRCTGCNIAATICIVSKFPPFSPSY